MRLFEVLDTNLVSFANVWHRIMNSPYASRFVRILRTKGWDGEPEDLYDYVTSRYLEQPKGEEHWEDAYNDIVKRCGFDSKMDYECAISRMSNFLRYAILASYRDLKRRFGIETDEPEKGSDEKKVKKFLFLSSLLSLKPDVSDVTIGDIFGFIDENFARFWVPTNVLKTLLVLVSQVSKRGFSSQGVINELFLKKSAGSSGIVNPEDWRDPEDVVRDVYNYIKDFGLTAKDAEDTVRFIYSNFADKPRNIATIRTMIDRDALNIVKKELARWLSR